MHASCLNFVIYKQAIVVTSFSVSSYENKDYRTKKKNGWRNTVLNFQQTAKRKKKEGLRKKARRVTKVSTWSFPPLRGCQRLKFDNNEHFLTVHYIQQIHFTKQIGDIPRGMFFSSFHTKIFYDGGKAIVSLLHGVQCTLWESTVSKKKKKGKHRHSAVVVSSHQSFQKRCHLRLKNLMMAWWHLKWAFFFF